MNWLWLDDVRTPPSPEGWDWVLDFEEALRWFGENGTPELASLDHDLADEHYPWNGKTYEQYTEKCGLDVVKWMMANSIFPERVVLHSQNPVGAARMVEALQAYRYVYTGFANVPGANNHSHIMERING